MNSRIQRNSFQQVIGVSEYAVGVGKSAAVSCLIGWLFYNSWWAVWICIPIGICYFLKWEKDCVEQKKREFRIQFQEALQSISASLSVGYSMENAIKEAKKDLDVLYPEDVMIQKQFNYMIRQLYLQIPLEQVLEEWAKRMEIEEVKNFASICSMAKKSGGNMIAIIRNSIVKIRDELEVKQEIETLLTAKKYEFKVMSIIPLGIVAYMRVSFPEFMDMLYGNGLGAGVMSVCLGIYIGAYILGEKIVSIEI